MTFGPTSLSSYCYSIEQGVNGPILLLVTQDVDASPTIFHAVANRASNTSHVPSILVDTNIVSGLAKGDLPPEQMEAVVTIVGMMQRSEVTLAGSTVLRDELNKIPAQHRGPHDAVANTLRTLKTNSSVTWLDPNIGVTVGSMPYAGLRKVLPDEPDARMIAIGEEHRQEFFMTDDRRSVLSHREQIASVCSIKPRRPTEILAELTRRST